MKYPELSPSVLFLLTLMTAVFLSWMKPWQLSLYLESETVRSAGVILLFTSLLLNMMAYRLFKKHLTPHAPFTIPAVLIDRGIFSFSRNPVYLALVLSQCGLGFVFDTVWLLFTALILFFTLHYLIVLEEEKVLKRTFKEEYERYKQNTRRWF